MLRRIQVYRLRRYSTYQGYVYHIVLVVDIWYPLSVRAVFALFGLSEFGSGTKSQSEFSNRDARISRLLSCLVARLLGQFTWNKLTA